MRHPRLICIDFSNKCHRDWDFFSASDPTHGNVNFLTKSEATSKGLAYVQADGTTILATDSTTKLKAGDNRDSCVLNSRVILV